MECNTLGPSISALYDGEEVPVEAAQHIASCANCRETLREYAQIAVELRLLEANQLKMPALPRITRKTRSLVSILTQKMRVPRFVAAICAVVIALLAGAWAHTRAQAPAEWFEYKIDSGIRGSGSVGGVARACGPKCQLQFRVSSDPQHHIVGMLEVQKIEDNRVYLALRAKAFASIPNAKQLADEIRDAPAVRCAYKPGDTLRVPVTGGGELQMKGVIATSPDGVPGWGFVIPAEPGENEVALREPVLIRDDTAIGGYRPGFAGGTAAGANSGFFRYSARGGLFAFGLKPFHGSVQGIVNYGQVRFTINGTKYTFFSGSRITGGTQPRPVWVLYLPHYRLSQHDRTKKDGTDESGVTSDIAAVLARMRAIKR